jgi:hypothetical protein
VAEQRTAAAEQRTAAVAEDLTVAAAVADVIKRSAVMFLVV